MPPSDESPPPAPASDEAAIRAADAAFYRAFGDLDFAAMSRCWLHAPDVTCVQPGWSPLHGWEEVRESWRAIFANTGFMTVRPSDVRVQVSGDLGVLTCVENLYSVNPGGTVQGAVACTHVYRRVAGAWKLVVHHGSPIAASRVPDAPQAGDN